MKYELTVKQMWIQTLLSMVYLPMVANKAEHYPFKDILSQLHGEEREEVLHGLDALVDLGIFKVDESDIWKTPRSEILFQGLGAIAGAPIDFVDDMKLFHPEFAGILELVSEEKRLEPPSWVNRVPERVYASMQPIGTSAESGIYSLGEKIILGLFFVMIVMGFMQFF